MDQAVGLDLMEGEMGSAQDKAAHLHVQLVDEVGWWGVDFGQEHGCWQAVYFHMRLKKSSLQGAQRWSWKQFRSSQRRQLCLQAPGAGPNQMPKMQRCTLRLSGLFLERIGLECAGAMIGVEVQAVFYFQHHILEVLASM